MGVHASRRDGRLSAGVEFDSRQGLRRLKEGWKAQSQDDERSAMYPPRHSHPWCPCGVVEFAVVVLGALSAAPRRTKSSPTTPLTRWIAGYENPREVLLKAKR